MISQTDYSELFQDLSREICSIEDADQLRQLCAEVERFDQGMLGDMLTKNLRVLYQQSRDFTNHTVTPELLPEFNRAQGRLDVLTFFENLCENIKFEAQKRIADLDTKQRKKDG
jgi:hypothetical protein